MVLGTTRSDVLSAKNNENEEKTLFRFGEGAAMPLHVSSPAFVPTPLVDRASDAELLERVSQRATNSSAARAAETEFYDRHARYLYCVLVQRVRRPLALSGREVEDLVQETFFRAFERAGTYHGGDAWDQTASAPFARLARRIAERLLADWLTDTREFLRRPTSTRWPSLSRSASSAHPSGGCCARRSTPERARARRLRVPPCTSPREEHQRLPTKSRRSWPNAGKRRTRTFRIRSRARRAQRVPATRLAALTEDA